MFDCHEVLKCLSDYFDGELDDDLLVEFEEHLEECTDARAVVRTFRQTIYLHQRPATRVPEDVHERLLAAIRKCSEEHR